MFKSLQTLLAIALVLVLVPLVSTKLSAQTSQSAGDVNCDGTVDIADLTKLVDNLFITGDPLCTLPSCPTFTIDFEDVPQQMKDNGLITTYRGVYFDTLINGLTQGWNCYNSIAVPHSGTQYLVNRAGNAEIGFTFPEDVLFHGAFFARATQHAETPEEYTAKRIRYHFYDSSLTEIEVTGWFDLESTPLWFSAERVVRRVVIEHGRDLPTYDNSPWETQANYFAMDDMEYLTIH